MTIDEAINILKQYVDYDNPDVPDFYTMEEAIKVIIKALEQEPKTGRWIACSDRLPEEKGYNLTTTIYGEVYCDYWTGEKFDRTEMVIAWQRLPEPYKAESEE